VFQLRLHVACGKRGFITAPYLMLPEAINCHRRLHLRGPHCPVSLRTKTGSLHFNAL